MAITFDTSELPFAVASIPISIITEEIEQSRGPGIDADTQSKIEVAVENAIDKRIVTDSD